MVSEPLPTVAAQFGYAAEVAAEPPGIHARLRLSVQSSPGGVSAHPVKLITFRQAMHNSALARDAGRLANSIGYLALSGAPQRQLWARH